MRAEYFEFNGISSKDVGIRIVSIDNNQNGEFKSNNKMEYNTSKATQTNRWNMHGFHYENPLSFSFQIMKWNKYKKEPNDEFTPAEQASCKRWLERTDRYKYLRFLTDKYEHIYFHCILTVQWYEIAGQCAGATVYVTCDSAKAYSEIQTFETNTQSNSTFTLYNNADSIGQTEMELIEIEVLQNGKISISNDLLSAFLPQRMQYQNKMEIDNCLKGEVLVINGLTKQISSNKTHETLADDYNYSPICLVNFEEQPVYTGGNGFHQKRINTFTNNGVPCNISIAYRTDRQVVI